MPSFFAAISTSWMWSRPWIVRAVVLAARLGPLDRARRSVFEAKIDHRVFGVVRDLAAEAAADLRRDDADLVLRDARCRARAGSATMCGFCEVTQSVTSLVADRYCASAARGSIALGMSRWLMMRSLTTTSAAWKAASTSPPATFQWKQTLPGTSAWSWGCALLAWPSRRRRRRAAARSRPRRRRPRRARA